MPVATRATTLFGLTALRSYLKANGTSDDATIALIGDGVSEKIEAYCGRPFVLRDITEVVDAEGQPFIRTKARPITTVSEAKYRFTLYDVWVSLNVTTEVVADTSLGVIYLKSLSFPAGPLLASVTYEAGFDDQDGASLPAGVVSVGLDFAKFCYNRWKSDSVIAASTSWGGMSLVPALPKDLMAALDHFVMRRL